MDYIIFDLEATCWEGNQMHRKQEIIEIGAVRLDAYGKRLSSFQKFIKPSEHPMLSPYCRQLTGIQQREIDSARDFRHAGRQFIEWVLGTDEDYTLCSWGARDRALLTSDCASAGLETDWLVPYIDLKLQYHQINGLQRKLGLKKCLLREGMVFDGNHHRALDDAMNLAGLFLRYLDIWVIP